MIQNAATNKALFFMTTLLPAIGYILMLVPMAFYNISGKDHHRMIEEIAERHAMEKTDEISENIEVKPEIK